MTLGENGIFTKVQYAKEQYEMAAVKEKLNLAMLEVQTEEINNGELTLDTMLIKLQEKLPGITIAKDGETLKGTLDGYDFTIDENFNVTIDGYNEEVGNGGSQEPEEPETYTVTLNGENVTSSGESTAEENASYTTTLTPAEGYKIATVEVKMGETMLTEGTHYIYENGTINIASVTGNLTITVTTEIIVTVTALTSYDETGILLSYSWEELEEVANVIANNPRIITNDTMGARVTIGTETYEVKVGNLVAVTYNSETYNTRIVGFNHDELTTKTAYENVDGSTNETAGISFEFMDCIMNVSINSTNYNTEGWDKTTLKSTLNSEIELNKLGNLSQIKEVEKICLLGNNNSTVTEVSTNQLWLLSCSEIWDNARDTNAAYGCALGKEGEQYKYYKEIDAEASETNEELVKNYNGSATYWWLRSPGYGNSEGFCLVNPGGDSNGGYAITSLGVAPGFAI